MKSRGQAGAHCPCKIDRDSYNMKVFIKQIKDSTIPTAINFISLGSCLIRLPRKLWSVRRIPTCETGLECKKSYNIMRKDHSERHG